MRIDEVVINASPLITLFRSGQANLLPCLFKRIVVPEAVWQEVTVAEKEDIASNELSKQPWPIRKSIVISSHVEEWALGAGETAVLSYALANPNLRAVIDDRAARRCAQTLNIPFLGMGALLVLAKRRGLLASVNDGLEKLRQSGLWLSEDIIRLLKAQAGE